MMETPDEIQAHIRDTREDLKANLSELEQKVKSATDWRQHYDKAPGLFLAAALGGGLLLAFATGKRRARPLPAPRAPAEAAVRSQGSSAPNESMGMIKSALIGLAASHAKDALSQLLPGFQAQLAQREKFGERAAEHRAPGNGESTQGAGRARN